MRTFVGFIGFVLVLATSTVPAWSASKPHVVSLGKPQTVTILLGPDESRSAAMAVRPLYVDAKLKDYTTGESHEVTDRLFVVQRAYRLNDSLPGDSPKQSTWVWERGGWLLVDRASGHITQLKLPDFDPANSNATWYRDYAAYCGTSDNGSRENAVVVQLGVRKPLFRKELARTGGGTEGLTMDCAPAKWERHPTRVTFSSNGQSFTYDVVSRHAEELPVGTDDEE